MGGVACEADVIDLVLLGHDGEGVVEQHVGPVDGLEILLATLTMILEHLEHVAAQMALTGYSLYLPQLLFLCLLSNLLILTTDAERVSS